MTRFPLLWLAMLGLHGVAAPLGAQEPALPWLTSEWPEADQLFQQDAHWVGGDGAYSIDLGKGRVLWLFGDSWIDPAGSGSRRHARMVSNTLAIQHGYDPARATATFYWGRGEDAQPRAFFADSGQVRHWPGHGVRLGDRLILFLMSVRATTGGLGFEVFSQEAVLVTNPDAPPSAWNMTRLDMPSGPPGVIVGSGAVLAWEEHLYAFSSHEPSTPHDIYLVRWPVEKARTGMLVDAQWWGGTDTGWIGNDAARALAKPVFKEGQSEFTVHRDAEREEFVQVQTMGFGRAVIVLRTAPALVGPWSRPMEIHRPAQNAFQNIMIYQGKAHPHLEGGGLILTWCTNSTRFKDHLDQPWLYFPRFAQWAPPASGVE